MRPACRSCWIFVWKSDIHFGGTGIVAGFIFLFSSIRLMQQLNPSLSGGSSSGVSSGKTSGNSLIGLKSSM